MALFPRIQSPCPYKDRLDAVMDGDFCRMCARQVHDISGMSDAERVALVAGCKDDICVTYRVVAKSALAAAAIGAAFGMPAAAAAAQDTAAAETESYAEEDPGIIFVGGLKMPKHVTWVDTKRPANLAELPVVYESGPAGAAPAAAAEDPGEEFVVVTAGGLKKAEPAPAKGDRKAKALPPLPVVEEDAPAPPAPVSSAS